MTDLDTALQKALQRWKKILRLEDWDIEVEFVQQYDLHDKTTLGETKSNLGLRQARLRLLHPDQTRPDNHELSWTPRWEETLIHELVHLHTNPILMYEGLAQEHAVEVLCDRVAQALLHMEDLVPKEKPTSGKFPFPPPLGLLHGKEAYLNDVGTLKEKMDEIC